MGSSYCAPPSTMKDDSPAAAPTVLDRTLAFMLTLAKEFADADTYAQTADKPESLPSPVLAAPPQSLVIRTRGEVAYDSEVTCIVTINSSADGEFAQRSPAAGGVIADQTSTDSPKWLKK